MAPPQWSVSLLVASLILLGLTGSSWSDSSINPSAISRFRRAVAPDTKDKAEKAIAVATTSLSVIKDVVELIDKSKAVTVVKALGDFAALAPGIGTAISAAISLILLFVPTKDPVMDAFAEVNRKLDALSNQISNLEINIKTYTFFSAYAKDEGGIISGSEKLTEFYKDKNVQKFIKYYENTGIQKKVENMYNFMRLKDTVAAKNINHLLRDQFKCHIGQMGKYYLYLDNLLLKGMILNQAYLELTKKSSPNDKKENVERLKEVNKIQLELIHDCLENYKSHLKTDVLEIAKGLTANNKLAIANKVKSTLDDKYSWYNWVVVVYNSDDAKKHKLFDMEKIPAGQVTVAVTYTLKSSEVEVEFVKKAAEKCFAKQKCDVQERLKECQETYFSKSPDGNSREIQITLAEYGRITDITKSKDFAEVPDPTFQVKCKTNFFSGRRKISMHYSRKLAVCKKNPCKNGGKCNRLLESNEFVCDCPESFYGQTCENKIDATKISFKAG